MISQRDGCPSADASAATSRPPVAVFAIALPGFDLGSLTELQT
jgi:hypothetical protein